MPLAIKQHELYDFLGLKINFEFYSKELPGNFLFTLCTKIKSGTCVQSVQLSKELIFFCSKCFNKLHGKCFNKLQTIYLKDYLMFREIWNSLDGEEFRRILWIKTWDNEV